MCFPLTSFRSVPSTTLTYCYPGAEFTVPLKGKLPVASRFRRDANRVARYANRVARYAIRVAQDSPKRKCLA